MTVKPWKTRWTPVISLAAIMMVIVCQTLADDKPEKQETWWSLRPLKRPATPSVAAENSAWVKTKIDLFIRARLQEKGLSPAPEADRRTLIRRLSYDLHGLPPTPGEVKAFVQDTSAEAYEKLVDRLLASPRYGERWARHWLDVAHYADSHGQDQDRPRPHAWPYRDYLIKAFNADTPYAQMIGEQVAGDVLYAENPSIIPATGFLAAGPWDESGLMGIREDSLDRQIAHYLDRDDMVTTTISTFAGATIHCARCHDHKFDPFTQQDYYALQAVFAGIDKADRTYDADPQVHRRRMRLQDELTMLRNLKNEVDPVLLSAPRIKEVIAAEEAWRNEQKSWVAPAILEVKASQGSLLKPLADKSILAVGKRPEKESYSVLLGCELPKIVSIRLEVLCDESLPHQGPGRCENGNLHLSEVKLSATARGSEKWQGIKIKNASADFNQEGWGIARAIDGDPATAWGIYPAIGESHQAVFTLEKPIENQAGSVLRVELDQLHGGGHLLGRFRITVSAASEKLAASNWPTTLSELFTIDPQWRTEAQQAKLARLVWERRIDKELMSLPPSQKVYSGTNRFVADGSFKPVQSPRMVHVLKRGEITKPGAVAKPGGIVAVGTPFTLDHPEQEGARRAALAQWLAHPENPLTWRTIVNRVWHYHFGKGIVDTPNDLGRMGGVPSHPELLDWLAVEFRDQGGSLKKLHKLIVMSATYRQSSRHNPAAAKVDGDNRLLWHMNRGRLDAEGVRDTILLASGKLDETMYGPPVKHFEMKPGIHVTPLADYDKFDVDSSDSRRRSIYRYLFRTRPDPLLAALDCPDASQSAPVRGQSVGALQALALWNNKFVLRYAEHLAELGKQAATDQRGQINAICQRLLQRDASEVETKDWQPFVEKHGLANWCRVMLNSSEFLFIE